MHCKVSQGPLYRPLGRMVLMVALLLGAMPSLVSAQEGGSGQFLVAKESMRDHRFMQSVVLITQHGAQGTVGVIINKQSKFFLAKVFPKFSKLQGNQARLNIGGPVSPRAFVFLIRATEALPQSLHVLDDIYLSSHPPLLHQLLERDDPTHGLRVFAGFTGWAPGQLDAEMARGDWFRVSADLQSIFDKPIDRIWPDLIQRHNDRWVVAPEKQMDVAG